MVSNLDCVTWKLKKYILKTRKHAQLFWFHCSEVGSGHWDLLACFQNVANFEKICCRLILSIITYIKLQVTKIGVQISISNFISLRNYQWLLENLCCSDQDLDFSSFASSRVFYVFHFLFCSSLVHDGCQFHLPDSLSHCIALHGILCSFNCPMLTQVEFWS